MRERKDVYKLPHGDKTLEWYGRAVAAMKALPKTDPLSWEYQAAVHGIDPLPTSMRRFWGHCQHGTSFFLPWHRMYILHFERIVAAQIVQFGGPADWALPYWNYTTSDPKTLALPPAFRNPKLPDGTPNPLYVALRNPTANAGNAVLGPRDVSLACLKAKGTTNPGDFFGGPPSVHFGRAPGAVELTPHNAVHGRIGNTPGGLMQDPDLAALDPIFWLHHSNIDRLWQVWQDCDPTHRNLSSTYWLSGVTFEFHDAAGKVVTMRSQDVLNLSDPLLDYKYSDASCPTAFKVAPAIAATAGPASAVGAPMTTPPHELVGATLKAVQLDDQVTHVDLPTPVSPQAFSMMRSGVAPKANAPAADLVQRATLHLEQVTSTDVSPTYDVFLNVPPNEDPDRHEDRFVARVAMFGIKQASDPLGSHGGGGQNFAFDITSLYHRLHAKGEIDPNNLRVSFVPVSPAGKPHVTVGRISLYFE